MATWQEVKEREIDELQLPKPPENCKEVVLPLPFGKGSYRLKYDEIRRARNTTLVTAYNRLVRVVSGNNMYWRSLPVEPYQRRIPTHVIERQERYEKSKELNRVNYN